MTYRTASRVVLGAFFASLALAPVAAAHVELSPNETTAGTEGRFALLVPNEEADASTVKIVVKFPESVPVASFQPVQGWTRCWRELRQLRWRSKRSRSLSPLYLPTLRTPSVRALSPA